MEKFNRAFSGIETDPASPVVVKQPTSGSLEPGRVVSDRYEIRSRLGQGGMGAVFRAYDRELGEEIALKVLLPMRLHDPAMWERLRREVRLARRITHPNVCRVFDYGEDADLRFLTMELIEGRTLRALLLEAPLSLEQALAIIGEIAAGLSAVHAQGIIHRDLKPENVMVRRTGQAVVMDFGLARDPLSEQSSAAGIAGTPTYMSPEQLRGEPLDARSDIFALGILAFEALTARSPFESGSNAATISAILRDPPRELEIAAAPADAVTALRRVLERTMAKSREDRFASAVEFGAALAESQERLHGKSDDGITSITPQVGSKPAVEPAPRRSRAVIAVPVALAAAITAVLALSPGPSRSGWSFNAGASVSSAQAEAGGADPRGRATSDEGARARVLVRPLDDRTGDAPRSGLADAAREAITVGLRTIPQLDVIHPIGGDPEAGQPGLAWIVTGSAQRIDAKIRLTVQIRAAAAGAAAGEPVEIDGDADNLTELIEEVRRRAVEEVRLLVRDHARLARARKAAAGDRSFTLLSQYYDLTRPVPGPEHIAEGTRMLDGALAVDPRFVPALVERAHLKVLTADSQGKREMRAAAVADLEQALSIEPGNPRALEIRCQMAQVEVHLSPRATDAAIAAAIKACHTALEADPSSARAHMALARLHDRVCQPGIAMTLLEKGVELDRALAGWLLAQSTEIAMRAGALGVAERASKELVLFVDREKRLGSRAYSRRAGVRPVRGAHVLRASVLLKLDRPDEARAELMRELDTISTGIGDQWNEATALRGLIRIARLRREAVPSALKGRLEALERDYKAAMKDAPNLGYSLASNYRWIEPDVALEWVTKLGPPSTFDGAFERALFYHAAGRDDEARRVLQAHSPKEQWEQTCLEWVHSQVSR